MIIKKYFLVPLLGVIALAGCGKENEEVTEKIQPIDPIAYYPFNGNAVDESGNGHDGAVVNAVLVSDRKGVANSAYRFNGTDSYISIPDSADLKGANGPYTFTLWFNSNSIASNRPILTKFFSTSSKDWGIMAINDQLLFASEKNSSQYDCYTPVGSISTNEWNFAAIVVDEPNITIYFNGAAVATCSGFINSWVATDAVIEIGKNSYGGNIFSGEIDDIRIYGRVLPSAEIDALYVE